MLGSVLCSPGCFSLYRCNAVREVLPTYATGVDHAFEFLTKDMGWCPSKISDNLRYKLLNYDTRRD